MIWRGSDGRIPSGALAPDSNTSADGTDILVPTSGSSIFRGAGLYRNLDAAQFLG